MSEGVTLGLDLMVQIWRRFWVMTQGRSFRGQWIILIFDQSSKIVFSQNFNLPRLFCIFAVI